mmetsp:Transcript_37010/g.119820  ORF Transcript_37010/g.119820 Transcript_37010/m.119820 type:complete len:254 (+) Transcript_37010:63-824(+)
MGCYEQIVLGRNIDIVAPRSKPRRREARLAPQLTSACGCASLQPLRSVHCGGGLAALGGLARLLLAAAAIPLLLLALAPLVVVVAPLVAAPLALLVALALAALLAARLLLAAARRGARRGRRLLVLRRLDLGVQLAERLPLQRLRQRTRKRLAAHDCSHLLPRRRRGECRAHQAAQRPLEGLDRGALLLSDRALHLGRLLARLLLELGDVRRERRARQARHLAPRVGGGGDRRGELVGRGGGGDGRCAAHAAQ